MAVSEIDGYTPVAREDDCVRTGFEGLSGLSVSAYANRLTRLLKMVVQPWDPNIIGIASTLSYSGLYRANIQRFVGPGFLHLCGLNRFLKGHGGRAMILPTTDHIRMLGAAQHSSAETQNAAQ